MKMKAIIMITLVGVFALLLAACSGPDSAASDPLDGTSWVLMAYRKSRPIPGTVITATFEDGQIHGSAGCNSYFGSYEVSGGTIKVGPIAITEMACLEPEGVMDQELTFVQFLQDAQTFRLTDEQLQIFTSDSEALTFIPPE
jgi:heat shock protein HslJ